MMPQTLRLSALELFYTDPSRPSADGIWSSIDLAPELERSGYSGYWLSEHHDRNSAHACPEILVPVLAGLTEHLRIGTAGVLLRYCSPLKLVKTFKLLAALYPFRIDLGIAGGFAVGPTHERLGGTKLSEFDYAANVSDLCSLLYGDVSHGINPPVESPPLWLWGSGERTATVAGRCGAAFGLGLSAHAGSGDPKAALQRYWDLFSPNAAQQTPVHAIAVAGLCAETEREAKHRVTQAHSGYRATIVGAPTQCRDELLELARRFETNEVVFIDLTLPASERLRSYQLLADAIGLGSTTAP